jgi:hypothetical protein
MESVEHVTPLGKWNFHNITERFIWTFLQAGVGSLPVTFGLTTDSLSAIGWSALTAGIASAVSLAKNITAEGVVVQAEKRVSPSVSPPIPPLIEGQP